jgi:hypothetical protein
VLFGIVLQMISSHFTSDLGTHQNVPRERKHRVNVNKMIEVVTLFFCYNKFLYDAYEK